jgi:hypothetical protein
MIVAIQQPEHLPWLGFFDKMRQCDVFILLDNVQFKKRYFENRNKIRVSNGWQWLTVPVQSKGRFTQKINEVLIDYSQSWQKKYLASLTAAYGKAPFYQAIFPSLSEIVNRDCVRLAELNCQLIYWLKGCFGLETITLLASDLVPEEYWGSDLILQLCRRAKAKAYISGPDGKNYLKGDEFQQYGIEVRYHQFEHPQYPQMHGGEFLSHMSAVDYLFNLGPSGAQP